MTLKEFKEILYSLFMAEEETKQENTQRYIIPACEITENAVLDFLKRHDFNRTFPLNLIELTKAIDGFSIFYLVDKEEYKDIEAAIDTKHKFIAINTRFKKSYLCGRYIICKMIAHIALGHIPQGATWTEPIESKRDEDDKRLNHITASFAYELLMPEKDFKEQWEKLGQDIEKMSVYFGASQTHIFQRKCYLFKEGNNGC